MDIDKLNEQDLDILRKICEDLEKAMNDGQQEVQSNQATLSEHYPQPPSSDHNQSHQAFKCAQCDQAYRQKSNLIRHIRSNHEGKRYSCEKCNKQYTRKCDLDHHLSTCSSKQDDRKRKIDEDPLKENKKQKLQSVCNWCGHEKQLVKNKKFCQDCGASGKECIGCHRPMPSKYFTIDVSRCNACTRKSQMGRGEVIGAIDNTVKIITLYPKQKYDLLLALAEQEYHIKETLEREIKEKTGIKFYLTVNAKMSKVKDDNEIVYDTPTFRMRSTTATNVGEISEKLAAGFQEINAAFDAFIRNGSGWTLDEISSIEVHAAQYNPFAGSSFISLPKYLQDKKAILNVMNNDQKCFIWSILAQLYPVSRKSKNNKAYHYKPHEYKLKIQGLTFPLPLNQVAKFEDQNNISVNVFGYESENDVYPLYISQSQKTTHVNLLLISDGEKQHYCLIKSMSRLLTCRTNHNGEKFFCNYCLHGFSQKHILEKHISFCSEHAPQKIKFPEKDEDKWLKFKNYAKQLRVPFVIFADFESFTTKCSEQKGENTLKYQKHVPSGFSYIVVSANSEFSKPVVVYRGESVVETFFERLIEEEKYITDVLNHPSPLQINDMDKQNYKESNSCHICGDLLGTDKVRDHDHLQYSGSNYRGAAHNACNLRFKFKTYNQNKPGSFFIPVIFHNLRGYDSHLLMESLGKFKERRLQCIPNNIEKYISFSSGNIRFLDSFQFLSTSLEKLVSNLAKDGIDKFELLGVHFQNPVQHNLLIRKGVYPYDYVDEPSKLRETSLPQKDQFFSNLTQQHISERDYEYAQQVWTQFNCQTLGDYHDLYLQTDVLLLADVFENFRTVCLESYGLDPAFYFTAPGLSWDAMLKKTKVELQLIDDPDMYLMVESGLRGGISVISQKYAKANNPYINDYDPGKPNNYIVYVDANNLYGWAMSQRLPHKHFDWMTDEQLKDIDIMNLSDESDTGYIFEVDMEYPAHLHDSHSDYPLAAERLQILESQLSPFSLELKSQLGMTATSSTKLVPNLYDKKKYVVHYRNLKLYMSLGMKVTKIHRAIEFHQTSWLEPYITFNTNKRKVAQSDFEKDFFKLMNNAIFGKTMENLRKRKNIELVHKKKRMLKLVAKPSFERFTIFNKDLAAVHLRKTELLLNRPITVGFSILDLSKTLMYGFHYQYMKRKYGDKVRLLFTDTDSFCYDVQTDDIYDDWKRDEDLFDFSSYPQDHPLYCTRNKKVIGKMKDETSGVAIEEFVGLRSKMYSLKYGDIEKRTAKGINMSAQSRLKHKLYRESLFENSVTNVEMNQIRSFSHSLYSIQTTKVGLSPFDDKRYVLADGISTLAHGHFSTL